MYIKIFKFIGILKWGMFEKIIMLVGVIGLGKIIFVDGIVNYVIGIRFDDLFRFIIV